MTLADLGGQIRAGRHSFACEGEAADHGAQTRSHAVGRLLEEHDLSTAGQGHAVGRRVRCQGEIVGQMVMVLAGRLQAAQ
jgi:hypothetical protein